VERHRPRHTAHSDTQACSAQNTHTDTSTHECPPVLLCVCVCHCVIPFPCALTGESAGGALEDSSDEHAAQQATAAQGTDHTGEGSGGRGRREGGERKGCVCVRCSGDVRVRRCVVCVAAARKTGQQKGRERERQRGPAGPVTARNAQCGHSGNKHRQRRETETLKNNTIITQTSPHASMHAFQQGSQSNGIERLKFRLNFFFLLENGPFDGRRSKGEQIWIKTAHTGACVDRIGKEERTVRPPRASPSRVDAMGTKARGGARFGENDGERKQKQKEGNGGCGDEVGPHGPRRKGANKDGAKGKNANKERKKETQARKGMRAAEREGSRQGRVKERVQKRRKRRKDQPHESCSMVAGPSSCAHLELRRCPPPLQSGASSARCTALCSFVVAQIHFPPGTSLVEGGLFSPLHCMW
jgi:hypothetical protein